MVYNPGKNDHPVAAGSSFRTTRYTMPGWSFNAVMSQGPTLGTKYYVPIFVPQPASWDRIGINVTGAGAAGKVARLGIYSSVAGQPANLLLDAGVVAIDGIAFQEQTIAWSPGRGPYFLAYVADGSPQVSVPNPADAFNPPLLGVAGTGGGAPTLINPYEAGLVAEVAGGLAAVATPNLNLGAWIWAMVWLRYA